MSNVPNHQIHVLDLFGICDLFETEDPPTSQLKIRKALHNGQGFSCSAN